MNLKYLFKKRLDTFLEYDEVHSVIIDEITYSDHSITKEC